jgi:hypothetical protein
MLCHPGPAPVPSAAVPVVSLDSCLIGYIMHTQIFLHNRLKWLVVPVIAEALVCLHERTLRPH